MIKAKITKLDNRTDAVESNDRGDGIREGMLVGELRVGGRLCLYYEQDGKDRVLRTSEIKGVSEHMGVKTVVTENSFYRVEASA